MSGRQKMDPVKFKTLYEKYYQPVYKQCYYLIGDNKLAEDVTQEVFIKLYHQTEDNILYPAAWLSKVAANSALNCIRGEKRRLKKEENLLCDVDQVFSIEETVVQNEEILKVRQVLAAMNDNQRICLLLKFSDYSYDEIHHATGIPKNNIGQLIVRGKQKFQELYEKEGNTHVLRNRYPSTSY